MSTMNLMENLTLKVTIINANQAHYMIGLVTGLAKNGVSVNVIDTVNTKNAFSHLANVHHYSFVRWPGPNQPIPKKVIRELLYPVLLLFYLLFTRSDIIHMQWEGGHFTWFYRYWIPVLCELRGKKLVFTAHNVNSKLRDTEQTDNYTVKSLSYLYHHCSGVIAHAQFIKDELLSQFALNPEKIHIIQHGCNDATPITGLSSSDARTELGVSKDAIVFLLFGGYRRSKNYELLFHAMPKILESYPESIVIVAGDCAKTKDYFLELRQLAKSLGISHSVIFYPEFISDEKVEFFFKAADAVVIPYKAIFLSGIPFTAFMFGVPVIASNIGAIPEVVRDNEYGMLFESENIQDLQVKLINFITSDLFRNPKKKVAIREYVTFNFSWPSIADSTIRLYKQLLQ